MACEQIKYLLDEAVQKDVIRGAVVVVGRAGEILFEMAAGMASQDLAAPMQTGALFDLGSLTQPIATSTIVMALATQNKINLNTPACHYWPDFSEDGKEKVTLKHLLKHTSGLPADRPYYGDLLLEHSDWAGTPKGAEFILNRLSSEGLEYPPAYAVVMSNLGFMVLGRIAEIIGDSPIDSIFSRCISSPLSLSNSFFKIPAERSRQCAATFFCPVRKKIVCGEIFEPNSWVMGGAAGHAGLFSSASDAVRIAMGLAQSLHREGGAWPREAVDGFIGPKAKYKLGWDTPSYSSPLCGSNFSKNTVGFVGNTCASLWLDLDKELAVAVFASPAEQYSDNPQMARSQFEAILPGIHDEVASNSKL